MSEFGHAGIISSTVCIDSWGVGPFVIAAGGKSYRFEDSDRFGPSLINKRGDPLKNPWPGPRSPFWRAHRLWARQGRHTEDGVICIWREPKPQTLRYLGGSKFVIAEHGEEDGATLVSTDDGERIPLLQYFAQLKKRAR
jgi:hypothetical protein